METKDFYDKLYSEHEIVFGLDPHPMVRRILDFKQSGTVLEIGAGEGGNALFLARKGFQVTASDISPMAIGKIQERASKLGVSIITEVRDITEGIFGKYDVIVATFVLHHLRSESALHLLKNMQEATVPGGLNVITTFTKQGDFYNDHPDTPNFYLDPGQLREFYDAWEILDYQETRGPAFQKRPDGSPMINTSANIVARKKS